MLKKHLVLVLTVLVMNLSFSTAIFAETKAEKEARFAAKVKSGIAKLGSGTDARIEVKLRDKTKLKGYISRVSENSFTVVNEKTGASTEVPYPNAKQVKGNNLANGVKIAIAIGIIFALGAILALASLSGESK